MRIEAKASARADSNGARARDWGRRRLHRVALGSVLFLLLAQTAAAVDFTPLTSGPCQKSEGFDMSGACADIGLDYNQAKGHLVSSVRFDAGDTPRNLVHINRITGARSPVPGFADASEELKVATVRRVQSQCPQQWPVGTIFTGNQNVGELVKIENGIVTNPWITLPGSDAVLRGGFFHDRWCVVDGDLIVVNGPALSDTNTGGRIWRVNALGNATLLGTIFRPDGATRAHLEGVITVPNDPVRYGTWAGKIVTGDEDRISCPGSGSPLCQPGDNGYRNGRNPKIYAIAPKTAPVDFSSSVNAPLPFSPPAPVSPLLPANPLTGAVCSQNNSAGNSPSCSTTFAVTGKVPNPKDFDFIEGDFFGVGLIHSPGPLPQRFILKAPAGDFPRQTTVFPDILITQAYPIDQPEILKGVSAPIGANSGLYTLVWNGSTFVSTELARAGGPDYSQWEQATFVPPSNFALIKSPKNSRGSDRPTFNVGDRLTFTLVLSGLGPGTATQIVVDDPLPAKGGLTWAFDQAGSSALEQSESCAVDGAQRLQCKFNKLLAGEQMRIVVRTSNAGGAPAAACAEGRFDTTATVKADGTGVIEDTGGYTCLPGTYTLRSTPKNATYNIGDNINFTITVTSTGPGTADNVTLNDPLPTLGNLNNWIITTNPGGLCQIVSNVLNCPFANLGNGETRTVVVATDSPGGADASACPGPQKLNNTARLTGTGLPKIDTGVYSCTPPPLESKTRAQSYWGSQNGLAALNALYATGLSSVSIGGRFSITFNGANLPNLINKFMPQRSAPKELMQSYRNPTRGSAVGQVNNLLVGQVLALQLSVLASDKNVAPLAPGLKHVVLPTKFAGVLLPANYTIDQVIADANNALGGGGLPSYASSISALNDIIDAINNLF